MEGTATVEQAEPQGSAAPGQDTSASANGDNGAATPASFGSIYKQRTLENAARRDARAGVSSADRETSAANEQPASSTQSASRPGAAASDADGTASTDADSRATDQPKLSRSQRKALRTGQTADEITTETVDSLGTSTTTVDDDDDPVVARVERVEKTVSEGLSRLEGLLKNPTPAQADPSIDGESKAYADLFGDDQEFERRAGIALHGSTKGEYLDTIEADELAVWASNRKARDFSSARAGRHHQSFLSAAVTAAAQEFGVPTEVISAPTATFRDIFGAFVNHGSTKQNAELTAANDKLAKLEAANRLLADQNEALEKRLPASARSVLHGGDASTSRAAAQADRQRMNGRQLMANGLQQQTRGRSSRPGAR